MGNCIYIRGASGRHPLEEREIASEHWQEGEGAYVGRILAKGHFANTTIGIWFYASDVGDKVELRRQLLALVDHVTAPEYRAEEVEHGRRLSAWLRGQGEASRERAKREAKRGETKKVGKKKGKTK